MLFRGGSQTRTEGPSPSSETTCRMVRPKGQNGGRAARACEAARILYIVKNKLALVLKVVEL